MEMDTPALQAELERILRSRCFRSRKILQKLLTYLVNLTTVGNADHINQYNIAVEGLGKPADFNPATDPLIRIQVGRLRKQLEEYYATEGRYNPLRISLLPRSYQPVFTHHSIDSKHYPVAAENLSPSLSQGPGIVCIPRSFVADETSGWPFITHLTRDYIQHTTRFNFCQILFADETLWQQPEQPAHIWHTTGADYALFFDLYQTDGSYHLQCRLIHNHSPQTVWEQAFPLGAHYPEPALLEKVFKRIAHDTITYDPGITHTHWTQQLLTSGKPLAPHHSVLAAVRQYLWEPSPATFQTSFQVCEQRLEKFPHDTQAWLVYANHCFAEYGVKFNVVDAPDSRIAQAATALLQLAPGNAHSYTCHAFSCLLDEDFDQCREALQTALTINPLDSYLNVQAGLLYLALDDWPTGIRLIQDSVDISPVYPDWYHIPLSISHYRNGRYLTALEEANKIRLKHLWTPMLRTALYHCNQTLDKGTQEYQRLINDHPDFPQVARIITHGFPQQISSILNKIWSHIPRH